jgi:hypothetical protein
VPSTPPRLPGPDELARLRSEVDRTEKELADAIERARKDRFEVAFAARDDVGAMLNAIKDVAVEWLHLHSAQMSHQGSFAQFMSELDRRAEERSVTETRAIRRATVWMMIFTAVIAVATVVGVLVAIFKH